MPRQKVDLEAWKPQVQQWLKDGLNYDEIRRNLWKEGGIQMSEKTFARRLREWNIYVKQAYLNNDMEKLRKRIREIFDEGQLTDVQAMQQLKREGFEVRAKTYQKLRLEMGLYKRSHEGFRAYSGPATGAADVNEVAGEAAPQEGSREGG